MKIGSPVKGLDGVCTKNIVGDVNTLEECINPKRLRAGGIAI